MSEKTNNIACPICGAELSANSRFCNICGAAIKDAATEESASAVGGADAVKQVSEKKADTANTANTENAKGEDIKPKKDEIATPLKPFELFEEAKIVSARKSVFEYLFSFFSKRFVGAVAVLLIAVILTVSWFVPFAHSKARINDEITYNVGFSCYDTVEFSVRSFFFLDHAELEDTRLYEKFQNETSEKEAFEKSLPLTLMKGSTPVRVSMVLTALLSLAYLSLCLILLIFSFIDVISAFIGLIRKKSSFSMPAGGLLIAICCLMPMLVLSFLSMSQFGTNNVLSLYSNDGVGLSAGGILTLITALVGGGAFCLQKAMSLKKPSKKFFNKTKVKNIFCAVFAFVLIISVFLPCIGINVYDEATGERETGIYVTPADLYEFSEDEMRYYRKTSSVNFSNMLRDVAEQAADGELDRSQVSFKVFYPLIFGCGRFDMRVLFYAINIMNLAVLLFGGLLLRSILMNAFFNRSNRKTLLTLKILTFIVALIDFIMLVALRVIAGDCITAQLSSILDVTMGAGPIIMLLCITVLLIFPQNPKEYKYIDRDHDNGDVSYAPYVVDGK